MIVKQQCNIVETIYSLNINPVYWEHLGQIFAMSNYMGEHKVQLRTKTTFILSTTFFLSNSSVEHYIHTRLAIKDSYIYQQMQLEQPNYLQWNYSKHYPGPRGFYWCAREPRSGENESRSSGKGKTSGYLGLNSHFHSDASCQTHQIDNYKRDQ